MNLKECYMRSWLFALFLVLAVSPVFAKVVTQTVDYKDGDQVLEGYVAYDADIYGKGVRPSNPDESKAESGKFYADRKLLRERVNAGLDQLENNPMVDTT